MRTSHYYHATTIAWIIQLSAYLPAAFAGPIPYDGHTATTLKIATFNIRTKAVNESTLRKEELPWHIRREPMIQSIIDHKPDIIGFQEPRQEQVDDLSIGLAPLWNCTSQLIWKGGDCLATCWNTETTDFLASDHYFHSETPEKLGSKDWNATWPMGTLTTNFKLKATNESFWAINTHFDPDSNWAKNKSAELILSREESIIQGRDDDDDNNQEHSNEHSLVFLFGDLNDNSTSSSYNILTGNRYITNSSTEENTFIDLRREFGSDLTTPTYESFTIGSETERKDPKLIDHIMLADNNALIDKEWKVNDVLVVDNDFKYNDTTYMFSDHRMMMAVLSHDEFGGIRRGCTSIKGGLD